MKQRTIKRGISFHLDIRAFYTSSFVRISVMDIIDLRNKKKILKQNIFYLMTLLLFVRIITVWYFFSFITWFVLF